jgi:hypothetical protein
MSYEQFAKMLLRVGLGIAASLALSSPLPFATKAHHLPQLSFFLALI